MKRDGEVLKPELVRQAEFAEAEEVFAELFGEVAADKLVAAVIESADAVLACVVAKSRPLGFC